MSSFLFKFNNIDNVNQYKIYVKYLHIKKVLILGNVKIIVDYIHQKAKQLLSLEQKVVAEPRGVYEKKY